MAVVKPASQVFAHVLIHRCLRESPELRALIITFGAAGFVALYRFVPAEETVYVLAFRHQKAAGY